MSDLVLDEDVRVARLLDAQAKAVALFDDIESYIAPGNATPMRGLDRAGQRCHWILEVHLVDRARQIGGFVEELLDVGTPALPPGQPASAG